MVKLKYLNTRYQYSALVMRTCDWPVTKLPEALFCLCSCMLQCLHALSGGTIEVADDLVQVFDKL